MKNVVFCILVNVMFFAGLGAQSQKPKVKLYAKPHAESVLLRWIVTDQEVWARGVHNGYDIYRSNTGINSVQKITSVPVKPYTPEQFSFKIGLFDGNDVEIDQSAVTVMACMYPDEYGLNFKIPFDENVDFGNDPSRIRWLFFSISSLGTTQAAEVGGMLFADNTASTNTAYTYYIVPAGMSVADTLASVFVSTAHRYPQVKPHISHSEVNNGTAYIIWPRPDSAYCTIAGYDIYRSKEKNGEYRILNKDMKLTLLDPYVSNTSNVSFVDTALEKKQTYFYKVQGIDVFGNRTLLSEPYELTEKTRIEYAPQLIDAVHRDKFLPTSHNYVKWQVKDGDLEQVKEFYVLRSESASSGFEVISPKLSPDTREFKDFNPLLDSYYDLLTIGEAGDSLYSGSLYVHVADTVPPSVPILHQAVCDSNGVIKLTWSHGYESDLNQFNIFRANKKHEEFSRIANILLDSTALSSAEIDSVYYDTISLRVLDGEVFYMIEAYDDTYTPSGFSNVIRVMRYDTILPAPPALINYKNEVGTIELIWGNSTSIDLARTVLYKRLRGEEVWHQLFAFQSSDTMPTHYVDTAIRRRQWYEYVMKAYDAGNLQSPYSNRFVIQAVDNGMRPEIEDFALDVNKRKHTVRLTWKYSYAGVDRFLLYRGENGGVCSIYTNIDGSQREYFDTQAAPGKQYRYKLRAIYANGAKSPFTQEIDVK